MNWILLIIAGFFEAGFAACLGKAKEAAGNAVWTGVGAVCTVLIGIIAFKDPAGFWRLFFIATLIGSIIGLKAISH
jgi:quaternary ammonium compound-resistance protein SugE